jgi:hypothetical protein
MILPPEFDRAFEHAPTPNPLILLLIPFGKTRTPPLRQVIGGFAFSGGTDLFATYA